VKILLTGGTGQLGRALIASAPPGTHIIAPPRADLDLTNPAQVAATLAATTPDLVINAAAFTAVDACETEPEAAHALNATAVATLADQAPKLVHFSSDFVFDGTAHRPILPNAMPSPISVYGASKAAGEKAAGPHALIIRTAWVHAATGHNFVHTMLRLMRERPEVRVVADQLGTPTHAASLARATWALLGHTGLHHFTDAGTASWYDFAVAIHDEALTLGLLTAATTITPIRSIEYPTPARRPAYAVLDKTQTWAITGIPAHWRHELRACLAAIRAAQP
jgi:dTDP-4-dehydrorhamnose reductase